MARCTKISKILLALREICVGIEKLAKNNASFTPCFSVASREESERHVTKKDKSVPPQKKERKAYRGQRDHKRERPASITVYPR